MYAAQWALIITPEHWSQNLKLFAGILWHLNIKISSIDLRLQFHYPCLNIFLIKAIKLLYNLSLFKLLFDWSDKLQW